MASASSVAILTYHSICDRPGPTSMGRAAFRMQMETLAAANAPVVSLRQVENWLAGEGAELPIGAIAITFDDAFQDFEVEALPVLTSYGFATAVFAPALCVGGVESWRGADEPPRPLMDWAAIERAQAAGVTIGSHALTHPDLTSLDDAQLEEEVALSRDMLERRLGAEVRYFAPPYGRSNQKVRAALARHYRLSFGVRLGEAGRDAARFDLPRVEMHYFRDPARWRDFVGGEKRYLAARQALRAVKNGAESAARRLRRRG